MGKLDDKIAIVTGAGQGIGKAIAEKQPADVANVVAFLPRTRRPSSPGQTVSVSCGLTMS